MWATCTLVVTPSRTIQSSAQSISFARRERQRHERLGWRLCRLTLLPAPDVAPHRIVAALVARGLQPLEDPQVVEPVTHRLTVVLLDQPLQILLECRQLWIGLNLPLVPGGSLSRAQVLAHRLPRQLQRPGNRPNAPALRVLPSHPCNRLHRQHPRMATLSSNPGWKSARS